MEWQSEHGLHPALARIQPELGALTIQCVEPRPCVGESDAEPVAWWRGLPRSVVANYEQKIIAIADRFDLHAALALEPAHSVLQCVLDERLQHERGHERVDELRRHALSHHQ